MAADSTLTLLFTDLVASTELASRDGNDAAQALRRAHNRLLVEQFESFGARIIKNTGDGFFVSLPSARQGVECAAAIQRSIATQHAEGRYLDLQIRVGLHTGEPEEENGDLFGIDVALASRIMNVAAGGEILISEITYLLARSHTKLQFAPDGTRDLKGFPEPVPVVRVIPANMDELVTRRQSRLVGREEEHERLRLRLDRARRGLGSTALLAGEPGVGKTRLMSEVIVEARDAGVTVLSGRAFETEGLPPYHAFTGALADLTRGRSGEELRQLLGDDARHIAKILPDLREALPELESSEPANDETERFRLFDAVTNTLIRCAKTVPLLVTIDDLHWADRATVHLVQHLARHIEKAPVLVLATYRDAEVPADHPLHAFVDELERAGPGERVLLTPLSRDDASALVLDVLGQAPSPRLADALFSAAAGNPFFTEELARQMRSPGGGIDETTHSPASIPESIRHILSRRFERLSEPTRDTVLCCVVLGSHLTTDRITAVSGTPEDDVLAALEEALAARVLREDGPSLTFSHPLVPEVLYAGLTAHRRRRWHRRAAMGLENLYGGEPGAHVQELAHHFLEAGADGHEVAKAIGYARSAAEHALSVYAYEDAAAYYRRSLAILEASTSPDPTERCELLLGLGVSTMRAGDAPTADATFWQAAEVARQLGSGELLATAAIGVGDARRTGGIVDEPLIALLGEALELLPEGDSALRACVMGRRVDALYHVEPIETLTVMAIDAVSMARRVGDATTLIRVLRPTGFALHGPHDLQGRMETANELEYLAKAVGDRGAELSAAQAQIDLYLRMGEIEQADVRIAAYGRQAEELRQPFYLWLHAVYVAMRALFDGRFEQAEQLAQQAFALGREAQSETNLAFQFLAIQLFNVRLEQGRLHELASVMNDFVTQYPALRWRVGTALIASEMNDAATAQAEYEQLFSHDLVDIPDDQNQVIALTMLTELCARFGDAHRAEIVYQRLVPFEGRNVTIGAPAACAGAACRFLGALAGTMRRWEDAERHFTSALRLNAKMGAAPALARTQFGFARMLSRSGRAGDCERAHEQLRLADETAERLGMVRLRSEIDALRQEAGS